MSSYNDIQKIKYTKETSAPVILREYILFSDDKAERKHIVFKLENRLDQRLFLFRMEVEQFDEEDKLLARSVVSYDDFTAQAGELFVPNAKLGVEYACKRIEANLTYAEFDRVKWEKGEFSDNSYRFDRFVQDTKPTVTAASTAAEHAKGKRHAAQKAKSPKRKWERIFRSRNISGSNVAVFPKVFHVLICILVLAFVAGSLFYFIKTSPKFTIDDFSVLKTDEGVVSILSYEGKEKEVTIPAALGDYKVNKVSAGAFHRSDAERIIFATDCMVEVGAFNGCSNLRSLSSTENRVALLEGAVTDCIALTEVRLPFGTLSANSLEGCTGVTTLIYGDCYAPTLSAVFGEKGKEHAAIDRLYTGMSSIGEGFFDLKVNDLRFTDESCAVAYGALKDADCKNYTLTDELELLNGNVISVKSGLKELTLPAEVSAFDAAKFASALGEVRALTVNTGKLNLNTLLPSAFSQLESLTVTNAFLIDDETLSACPDLKELHAPVLSQSRSVSNYLKNNPALTKLGIVGSGTVTKKYLEGLNRVDMLTVAANLDVEQDAFTGIADLRGLALGVYGNNRIAEQFGGLEHLKTLTVLPGRRNAIPAYYFTGLLNLEKIVVEEGITSCGVQIVNEQPKLKSIGFPSGLSWFNAYPVIGEGCTSLEHVTVTIKSSLPSGYSAFNKSAQYTHRLKISLGMQTVTKSFFADCGRLQTLSLTAGKLTDGMLLSCAALRYLELHAPLTGRTLTGLFDGAENTIVLDTVVVEADFVPREFFRYDGSITPKNIWLMGVGAIGENVFAGCEGLASIYIPKSLPFDETLNAALSGAGVATVYFEGEIPAEWKKTKYVENYGDISDYLFDFS